MSWPADLGNGAPFGDFPTLHGYHPREQLLIQRFDAALRWLRTVADALPPRATARHQDRPRDTITLAPLSETQLSEQFDLNLASLREIAAGRGSTPPSD